MWNLVKSTAILNLKVVMGIAQCLIFRLIRLAPVQKLQDVTGRETPVSAQLLKLFMILKLPVRKFQVATGIVILVIVLTKPIKIKRKNVQNMVVRGIARFEPANVKHRKHHASRQVPAVAQTLIGIIIIVLVS